MNNHLHGDAETEELTLEGIVENVVYRNAQNGYAVLELDAGGELITAVGELGVVDEGEVLILKGAYTTHARFGPQFQAVYCERRLPETAVSIKKYLSSGVISGIGPTLAKKIVDEFGERTLEIMEKNPEKLTVIKGISPAKCEKISQEFRQIFNLRQLMKYFSEFRIQSRYAMLAYKNWGFESMVMIRENPYLLCREEIGLPFRKAEEIADSLELPRISVQRIGAGIKYILQRNSLEGHVCLPLDVLERLSLDYLDISGKDFYEAYNYETEERNIIEYLKNDRAFIYLTDYFNAESYISGRIGVINAFAPSDETDFSALIDLEEEQSGIKYAQKQREAITMALSKGLLILTGGPGTGKTTTLNAIISLYEQQGQRVVLAAPTGRAAKRMSELTGRDAKTIHRLLEMEYDAEGRLKFRHNENNLLGCSVIVIDEMSMVDTLLFEALLKALKISCRIIIVGDSNQLPSVGAGNVLQSLIKSRRLKVVALKEIFRQAQQSCIVTNAHKIVRGEMPELDCKDRDFFFFERKTSEGVLNLLSSLTAVRLPKAYGYSPFDDIQIMSPSRKGVLGVVELNKHLQSLLNPHKSGMPEAKTALYTLREGDKIMQIKNNYDIIWKKNGENGTGVFNGDIGRIVEIRKRSMELTADFDGRETTYTFEQLDQLELAYAITVHKSQGSEFDAVIMPLLDGFKALYYRNLLYTAVTRAKKLLILIGDKEKIQYMVDNHKRTLRYTCLQHMLEQEIDKEQ